MNIPRNLKGIVFIGGRGKKTWQTDGFLVQVLEDGVYMGISGGLHLRHMSSDGILHCAYSAGA